MTARLVWLVLASATSRLAADPERVRQGRVTVRTSRVSVGEQDLGFGRDGAGLVGFSGADGDAAGWASPHRPLFVLIDARERAF
jgi:hypothetical protein